MDSLKNLNKRVNTILAMVSVGILMGLALSWSYYQSRRMAVSEKTDFVAELLAYDLPHEAVTVMEEIVARQPLSSEGLRVRRVLADVLMGRVGDFEKALGHLVFLKVHGDTGQSEEVEQGIQRCMNRLGRVYDLQRRLLVAEGKNPLQSEVSHQTVVKLGNESAVTVDQLKQQLARMGIAQSNPPRDALDNIVKSMASEILLRRAARRSGVRSSRNFLDQVRSFEENLELQIYLEDEVLKGVEVDEQAVALFIQQNKKLFESPMKVVFSRFKFEEFSVARDYVYGSKNATQPLLIDDKVTATLEQLPSALRGINWINDPVTGTLGPLKEGEDWVVFEIHNVVPPTSVPPELAASQARLRLLEQKQGGEIGKKIAALAAGEELKIIEENITDAFYSEKQTGNPGN